MMTEKRSHNSPRGAAVVEFAILAALLAVFAFGIIEFGFLWLQSHYIANASREGARIAAKLDNPETTDLATVEDAVKEYLKKIPFYENKINNPSNCCSEGRFLYILVREDSLSVGGNTVDAVRVSLTVQTEEIWEPVLWDLLKILPAFDRADISQVVETAIFPKK